MQKKVYSRARRLNDVRLTCSKSGEAEPASFVVRPYSKVVTIVPGVANWSKVTTRISNINFVAKFKNDDIACLQLLTTSGAPGFAQEDIFVFSLVSFSVFPGINYKF